jgi:hypothetical protein
VEEGLSERRTDMTWIAGLRMHGGAPYFISPEEVIACYLAAAGPSCPCRYWTEFTPPSQPELPETPELPLHTERVMWWEADLETSFLLRFLRASWIPYL